MSSLLLFVKVFVYSQYSKISPRLMVKQSLSVSSLSWMQLLNIHNIKWERSTVISVSQTTIKMKKRTQKEIQDRLEAQGIYVIQTTRRDLREIGLIYVVKKKADLLCFGAWDWRDWFYKEFLAKYVECNRAEFSSIFARAWESNSATMLWITRLIAVFWGTAVVPILF